MPRFKSFDILRVVSVLLVLLVHVSAQWTEKAVPGSAESAFALACNILAFTGVALFVMLSGALALSPLKEDKGVLYILKHRTLKYFLIYFIWKALYFAAGLISAGRAGDPLAWKEDVILALFKKPGEYHLWFLPMLGIIFLLVPIIKKGCEKKENCLLFISVFFIFGIFLPNLFLFDFPFKYLLMDLAGLFDLSVFTGYAGYFVLGHYIFSFWNEEKRSGKDQILILIAAAILFAFSVLAAVTQSFKDGAPCYAFSTPMSTQVFFIAAAVFAFFSRPLKAEIPVILPKSSFIVYLIHPFVLEFILSSGLVKTDMSAFAGIPLMLVLLALISFALAILYNIIIGGKGF